MSGWFVALWVTLAVVVVGIALLALLAARRRWLAKAGNTFECSVRLNTATPSAGWALGVARYNVDALDWFRFFSYALSPRKSFRRGDVQVAQTRDPDAVEAVALYHGQVVVTLTDQAPEPGDRREWDLAMSPESLTGLMSWLEAAPPGPPPST